MPTRTKITANQDIFVRLDKFCADRDQPIRNAAKHRYISSENFDRQFIVDAVSIRSLTLSPSLVLHQFNCGNKSFFFTAGFDTLDIPPGLSEEDVTGSLLTAFLSETELRPSATPLEIRQVVEIGQMGDPLYSGHDPSYIASLFPTIRCFSVEQLDSTESENISLLFCLGDRRRSEHWIDDQLARSLARLAGVSATSIPFRSLCRSVLDIEPAALFMSLYRCLESLYARARTTELMNALGVNKSWLEVAQLLELHLGWYPREEQSLEQLLAGAEVSDLVAVVDSFGDTLTGDAKPAAAAAHRIYALRNSLVHYRPFHHGSSSQDPDWSRLCESMVSLVISVS